MCRFEERIAARRKDRRECARFARLFRRKYPGIALPLNWPVGTAKDELDGPVLRVNLPNDYQLQTQQNRQP